MKLLFTLMKEIYESVRHFFRCLSVSPDPTIKKILSDGFIVIPGFFSSERCELLRSRLDRLIAEDSVNVWRDFAGADNRVYFAESVDDLMMDFYKDPFIRQKLYEYTGTRDPVGMVLGARIDSVEGNVGSGGGWHRDSPVSRQFKALIYLSDVSPDNGPFQYIKHSHQKWKVINAYFKRIFRPSQYRFTGAEIEYYLCQMGAVVETICGQQGTLILVDTKGIHQGAPLSIGSRHALFCYFWDKEIPDHFLSLRQGVKCKQ